MNKFNAFLLSLFLYTPSIACTKEEQKIKISTENENEYLLLDSGDIFTQIKNKDGQTEANYFSTQPASQAVIAKRLTWILSQVKASSDIINFAESRLPNNRRLTKDSFTLPLTDKDGNVHQFNYSSDIQQRFYSINYKQL